MDAATPQAPASPLRSGSLSRLLHPSLGLRGRGTGAPPDSSSLLAYLSRRNRMRNARTTAARRDTRRGLRLLTPAGLHRATRQAASDHVLASGPASLVIASACPAAPL